METFKNELALFLDKIGYQQTRTALLAEFQARPVVAGEHDALAYLGGDLISEAPAAQ